MKIKHLGSSITISEWKKKRTFTRLVSLVSLSFIFFYLAGLSAAIVAFLFSIAGMSLVILIEGLANFDKTTIDFAKNTIVSSSKFLGVQLKNQKLENVNFNLLEFKEYRRNGGRFKKYALEYKDGNSKNIVFRINKSEERDLILKEIKRGTSSKSQIGMNQL